MAEAEIRRIFAANIAESPDCKECGTIAAPPVAVLFDWPRLDHDGIRSGDKTIDEQARVYNNLLSIIFGVVCLNLRQIEFFRAVMISGSALRAVELLGVTQPAVSWAISDLELHIDFSLFDRIKGWLMAIPERRLFFTDANAAIVGLDSLRSSRRPYSRFW